MMKSNNVDFLGHIDDLKSINPTEKSVNIPDSQPQLHNYNYQQPNLDINMVSNDLPPPEKIDISKIRWNPDFIKAK